jgi:hypothetical protein
VGPRHGTAATANRNVGRSLAEAVDVAARRRSVCAGHVRARGSGVDHTQRLAVAEARVEKVLATLPTDRWVV